MEKILIFGVSGFAGRYLAKELVESGYTVYGTDLAKNPALPREVEFIKSDVMKADEVEKVVLSVNPDAVVNLAAVNSVGDSWNNLMRTISVNVSGALNILEAVRKCEPIPKILFIGSSEEYESTSDNITEDMKLNSNNPYGVSTITQDYLMEIYKEHYKMECYYVRPFNQLGVGQKTNSALPSFCHQVAEIEKSGKSGVVEVGNLDVERDYTDIRDIVRAYRLILEGENSATIYNIGSGRTYTMRELLEYIISLSSQEIEIKVNPELVRPVDSQRICCDYSKIKNELGWSPEYDIKDTLVEMYEDYLMN